MANKITVKALKTTMWAHYSCYVKYLCLQEWSIPCGWTIIGGNSNCWTGICRAKQSCEKYFWMIMGKYVQVHMLVVIIYSLCLILWISIFLSWENLRLHVARPDRLPPCLFSHSFGENQLMIHVRTSWNSTDFVQTRSMFLSAFWAFCISRREIRDEIDFYCLQFLWGWTNYRTWTPQSCSLPMG